MVDPDGRPPPCGKRSSHSAGVFYHGASHRSLASAFDQTFVSTTVHSYERRSLMPPSFGRNAPSDNAERSRSRRPDLRDRRRPAESRGVRDPPRQLGRQRIGYSVERRCRRSFSIRSRNHSRFAVAVCRRVLSGFRQLDDERCSAALPRAEVKAAAHPLGELARDVQAEPSAARRLR